MSFEENFNHPNNSYSEDNNPPEPFSTRRSSASTGRKKKLTTEPLRILVADDELELLWLARKQLKNEGFHVLTCENGEEAITALRGASIDILLTDIHMPGINGLELLQWVQENQPHLSVIAITGQGAPAIKNLCFRRGAALYLEKPVDWSFLLQMIRSLRDREKKGFSGTINQIDLFQYLQLLLQARIQCVVEVCSHSNEQCLLFVQDGTISHVVCGDREGVEAFYHCLDFEGGTFVTLPWYPPPRQSIDLPGEFLLLETARRKDERENQRSNPLDHLFRDL